MKKENKNYTVAQLHTMIEKAWMEITGDKGIVKDLEQDLEKFLKGNQTAGTRARKGFQGIKNLAQDIRIWIQEVKNKK